MASEHKEITLYGAGGHASVVLATARAAQLMVTSVYADDQASSAKFANKHKIRQTLVLESLPCAVHLAIGENPVRRDLSIRHSGLAWCAPIIHPSAILAEDIEIGAGTMVSAGAIIQPGARIGRHVIVNTGAIIEHDCVIGDYCHIGPGAVLSGDVTLKEGVLLGAGATVLKGRFVDAWTRVGAGAAVVKNLAAATTAVGVPARPLPKFPSK